MHRNPSTDQVSTWLDHLERARKHLASSGLSPRLVSALLELWVDQVEREDHEGVTLKEWVEIAAPEEPKRLFGELLEALPRILRSGRLVKERHQDRPQTYRLIMPGSFAGVRRPDIEGWDT